MAGAVISIIINVLVMLAFLIRDDIGDTLKLSIVAFSLFFILLSIVGTLVYWKSRKKAAGLTAMIGFAVFIPVGFIGVHSIKKQMNQDIIDSVKEKMES